MPENRSFLNNDHEGYERVEDFWNNGDDAGYELGKQNLNFPAYFVRKCV